MSLLARSERPKCDELRPVGFSILLASPAIPRLDDRAWRLSRQQGLQRDKHDCALLGGLLRFTERMSQGPFQEDGARCAYGLRQVTRQRNADRCDAGSFQTACDQSHGPIAKPSGRRQECKVDAIFAQLCRDFWGGALRQQRKLLAFDMPH